MTSQDPPPPVHSADYGPLAPVYLLLTALLTGGGALRTQRRLLAHIRPGDRVLQVGCGPGDFNVDLARSGAVVTYVDIAPAMVARARRRVEAAIGPDHPHRFLAADLTRLPPDERYDVVIAAFFLNTFGWRDCLVVLDHLCARVAPGGLLCIADETRSRNAALAWMLDKSRPVVLWIYGLFTGQPVHGLYDYDPELVARGWEVVDRQRDARDYLEATAWRRREMAS
ncbi:class I SAM-dependent methyltransferase [Myxococcota bacterium]|nr:class I SAM-dependent methyltransferase [Myxococcota bacterium]